LPSRCAIVVVCDKKAFIDWLFHCNALLFPSLVILVEVIEILPFPFSARICTTEISHTQNHKIFAVLFNALVAFFAWHIPLLIFLRVFYFIICRHWETNHRIIFYNGNLWHFINDCTSIDAVAYPQNFAFFTFYHNTTICAVSHLSLHCAHCLYAV